MSAQRETSLETLLSRVLYYGGLASGAVIVVGLLLLIPARGADRALVEQLRLPTAVSNVPPGLGDLVADAVRGQATAVVMLGILLLIATPVIRVVAAVTYFSRHRDRAFAAIGVIVLALLLVGFFIGRSSAARPPRGDHAKPAVRLTL